MDNPLPVFKISIGYNILFLILLDVAYKYLL